MRAELSDQLCSYDASALAEAILTRRMSAVDVVEAHFTRIERLNKDYNALVTLDKAGAIQRAAKADKDLVDGKVWGPLHGVPITIKDSFLTEGLRTTVGHMKYSDFIPSSDAWVVKKLKDAGAIVLGKSNCAALCGDVQTNNAIFGATNNPWDLGRTAGGSSGGEAAAVALGMSPLGLGSDTGGSIRIPASYCGVFGFKPSWGVIPREGLLPLHDSAHPRQDSLTVVGPIARSIRDLICCHKILTENLDADELAPSSPKIFWTHRFDRFAVDDEVSQIFDDGLANLQKDGLDVIEVDEPIAFGDLFGKYARLQLFEFMAKESNPPVYYFLWLSELARSLFRGGVSKSYARLKDEQAVLTVKVEEFMKGCDCWVLPATPSAAFAHQRPGAPIALTFNGRKEKRGYYDASAGLAFPFNMLGNPSVVLPLARSRDGMPIAMQVVGKVGEDLKLLRAAACLSEVLGRPAKASLP
jgi:amidase